MDFNSVNKSDSTFILEVYEFALQKCPTYM